MYKKIIKKLSKYYDRNLHKREQAIVYIVKKYTFFCNLFII